MPRGQIFGDLYDDVLGFFGGVVGRSQASLFAVSDGKRAGVQCGLTRRSVPAGLPRRRGGAAEEEHPVADRGSAGHRLPAGTSASPPRGVE